MENFFFSAVMSMDSFYVYLNLYLYQEKTGR